MTFILKDGERIEVPDESVWPSVPEIDRLRNTARENIMNAPSKGFKGPTGKELFNGNR